MRRLSMLPGALPAQAPVVPDANDRGDTPLPAPSAFPAISRRGFLAAGVLYGGAVALGWLARPRPRAWAAAAASASPAALSAEQWRTLEAITARIIPADDTPGAREAGCVNFIDKALANEDAALKSVYEAGLRAVDAYARRRHGKAFADLESDAQDALLVALQDGKAEGWDANVSSPQFFEAVRIHTIIGFVSDPKHGGNRDYAGWKLVGYPGASHHRGGYTPAQLAGEDAIVNVWEDD